MTIRTTRLTIGATFLLLLGIASCDSQKRNAVQPSPVTPVIGLARVELVAPGSIAPGDSVQLTANAVKSDNSIEDVTAQAHWSSSNPGVVEVGSTGLLKAIAVGEATIVVSYQSRSASTRTFVLPVGTYRLGGAVTDAGYGIRGATVTVLSGVGEGLMSVTSDDGGVYALYGVSGRVRIQVKKDGYANRVDELDVTDHRTVAFQLVPDHARIDISGIYTLTLSAAPCAGGSGLPADVRSRSYTAAIMQDGPQLDVRLTGADFSVMRGRGDHFTGVVRGGDEVRFVLGSSFYYYYYYTNDYDLVERLSGNTALIVNGTVIARVTSASISGTLEGSFLLASGTAPPFITLQTRCYARSHRFEMVRR